VQTIAPEQIQADDVALFLAERERDEAAPQIGLGSDGNRDATQQRRLAISARRDDQMMT
jgi:hypothetical protein